MTTRRQFLTGCAALAGAAVAAPLITRAPIYDAPVIADDGELYIPVHPQAIKDFEMEFGRYYSFRFIESKHVPTSAPRIPHWQTLNRTWRS